MLESYEQILLAESNRKEFPYLGYLMDGWLNQDYELMGGSTSAGIIRSYQESTSKTWQERTAADAHKFLERFGKNDAMLIEAMNIAFDPCFLIEGWEGLTTREWLQEVARILS